MTAPAMPMLKSLADAALLAVASVYGAQTYIEDSGPGDVFLISLVAARKRGESSGLWRFVAGAIDCHKCLSLWLAVALLALRAVSRKAFLFIAAPLSVSAISTVWQEYRERI